MNILPLPGFVAAPPPVQTDPARDQYFTPAIYAESLFQRFVRRIRRTDFFVDLGCGDGVWLNCVPKRAEAVGIELDPRFAARSSERTGRQIFCADFRDVVLPTRPTRFIGNPPFSGDTLDAVLAYAYDNLVNGGHYYMILPASSFSSSDRFAQWRTRWSMRAHILPRAVFSWASWTPAFCVFSKDKLRRVQGLCLFPEAEAVADAPRTVRMVLLQGRAHRSAWRAIVEDAIAAFGGKATRQQIRSYIAPRRPTTNRWWQDKLRQVLNTYFQSDNSGCYYAT